MAYGGLHKLIDAVAKIRRNPVSKQLIQPEYGDGQTDAGRDCRNLSGIFRVRVNSNKALSLLCLFSAT